MFYGEELLATSSSSKLEADLLLASAIAYLIYSQLTTTLEAVPPSAT
jgi:hypothetical protein